MLSAIVELYAVLLSFVALVRGLVSRALSPGWCCLLLLSLELPMIFSLWPPLLCAPGFPWNAWLIPYMV